MEDLSQFRTRLCSLGCCQGTKTMKSSYIFLVCDTFFKPKTVCSPTEPLCRQLGIGHHSITESSPWLLQAHELMGVFPSCPTPWFFSPCVRWHNVPLFLLNHFSCPKYLPIIHCVILNKPLRASSSCQFTVLARVVQKGQ